MSIIPEKKEEVISPPVYPYKPLEIGKFFIEKSLFLVSRHPFFEQFERLLLDIYSSITKEGIKAPLEDLIARLVY